MDLQEFTNSNVFLYGAGNFGKWAYKILEKNCHIKGLLDKHPKTKDVINPYTTPVDTSNAIVIVTILNRDVNFVEVKNSLHDIGFLKVYSFYELYKHPELEIPDWYWFSSDLSYLDCQQTIARTESLLSDNLSKQVFRDTIRARRAFDITMLPKTNPIDEQYFSSDLPLNFYDTFIDCGAYDGDTLADMYECGHQCEWYYAFEPDTKSYNLLVMRLKSLKQKGLAIPCGVFSESKIMHFSDESTEGSAITETGTNAIQTVALDDFFHDNISPNTYLKMDIEGAEYDAIIGGKKIIQQMSNLAICVYHKPSDLVRLPILISNFGDYDFYLRQYGYYGMDLVLFAVKKHQ
jgi:FkbM family methyltransferase